MVQRRAEGRTWRCLGWGSQGKGRLRSGELDVTWWRVEVLLGGYGEGVVGGGMWRGKEGEKGLEKR